MISYRVRPKFKHFSTKPLAEVVRLLNGALENTEQPIEGKVFHTHGLYRIKASERHYWSPQLGLTFEETDQNQTLIRGLYGPHPTVWAMFLMGYVLLGVSAFTLFNIGLVRLSLNLSAHILFVVPVLGLGIVAMWFIAQAGQKTGEEQTHLIHHFVEISLGEPITISKIR